MSTVVPNVQDHPKSIGRHASLALLLFLLVNPFSFAQTLTVMAPDTCENGVICPVTVSSSVPLPAGTVLGIAVNGVEAVKAAVLAGSLGEFSTRLILDANGFSRITAYCPGCGSSEKRVNVGVSSTLTSSMSDPRAIRVRSTPGDFRVLVDTGGQPPGHGYALLDAADLKVAVQLSPRISANP